MRYLIRSVGVFLLSSLLFVSCNKADHQITNQPVSVSDSTFRITLLNKVDVNEFDLIYEINPPIQKTYSDIYLQWSTSADFSTVADSVRLAENTSNLLKGTYSLKRLKQNTTYYARLLLKLQNIRFGSQVHEFKTDSIRFFNYPKALSKGEYSTIRTNHSVVSKADTSIKVFLNDVACLTSYRNGEITAFTVPKNIQSGNYALKFEKGGISATAPDSVEVLKGSWTAFTGPEFPEGAYPGPNALGFFGACASETKAYVVGGKYLNHLPAMNSPIDINHPNYVLEFDPELKTWKKFFTNPSMNFKKPGCFYYNNGIYVISGTIESGCCFQTVRHMYKFDLATLNWSKLDTLPYKTVYNPVSFELNGEWYVGMGTDSANKNLCCSEPLPLNHMWKYNPTSKIWSRIADFPGSYQQEPTGFSFNGKAYVFMNAVKIGYFADWTVREFRQEFWEYDPIANSWRQVSLPSGMLPFGEMYSIAGYNGKLYFFTAQRWTVDLSGYGYVLETPMIEYDPIKNTYQKFSSHPNVKMLKLLFQKGDRFYFQGNATNYYLGFPHETWEFRLN